MAKRISGGVLVEFEPRILGATAMGVHGLVHATEDIDLFIKATPENVEPARRLSNGGCQMSALTVSLFLLARTVDLPGV